MISNFTFFLTSPARNEILSMGEMKGSFKMTPTTNAATELRVQRTWLDLDSFEDITLVKRGPFTPVKSAEEARERVNGNGDKFLEIFNRGLKAVEQQELKDNDEIPWYPLGDDGKLSETPYSGTPADPALVNPLVLSIAKGSCGYLQAKDAKEKAAAKQKAIEMIKSFPPMLEGIKQQALAAAKAEKDSE